jgi:hypothetical protein
LKGSPVAPDSFTHATPYSYLLDFLTNDRDCRRSVDRRRISSCSPRLPLLLYSFTCLLVYSLSAASLLLVSAASSLATSTPVDCSSALLRSLGLRVSLSFLLRFRLLLLRLLRLLDLDQVSTQRYLVLLSTASAPIPPLLRSNLGLLISPLSADAPVTSLPVDDPEVDSPLAPISSARGFSCSGLFSAALLASDCLVDVLACSGPGSAASSLDPSLALRGFLFTRFAGSNDSLGFRTRSADRSACCVSFSFTPLLLYSFTSSFLPRNSTSRSDRSTGIDRRVVRSVRRVVGSSVVCALVLWGLWGSGVDSQ